MCACACCVHKKIWSLLIPSLLFYIIIVPFSVITYLSGNCSLRNWIFNLHLTSWAKKFVPSSSVNWYSVTLVRLETGVTATRCCYHYRYTHLSSAFDFQSSLWSDAWDSQASFTSVLSLWIAEYGGFVHEAWCFILKHLPSEKSLVYPCYRWILQLHLPERFLSLTNFSEKRVDDTFFLMEKYSPGEYLLHNGVYVSLVCNDKCLVFWTGNSI